LLPVSIGVVGTGRAGISAVPAASFGRIILDKYILPFNTPAFNIGAAGMLGGIGNAESESTGKIYWEIIKPAI